MTLAPEARMQPMLTAAAVDGRPLDMRHLYLGVVPTSATRRLPLALNPAEIMVATLGAPVPAHDGGVTIAVQSVLSATAAALTIDAGTAEHLRALGYAE